MRFTITVVALLLATAASADPVITTVTPNTSPVTGGTKVTIKGTGFSNHCINCSPPFADPEVYFLQTKALSVTFIDDKTIEAVTPPHLPATVPVQLFQKDGSSSWAYLENAFTFTGDANEAFDPILFPIFTRPVQGAFGSEFHTTPRIWNQDPLGGVVPLYGVDTSCTLIDPPIDPLFPFSMQGGGMDIQLIPGCSESVGHLFWVPKGKDTMAGNLRVTDVTRQAESHGVEIPVVHRKDFSEERISLLGVPIDPRFRNTLRIYSLARGEVLVNLQVGDQGHQLVLPAAPDWFTPAFASFTDFPLPQDLGPAQKSIRVTVDTPRGPGGTAIPGTPIWAFITVTNNDTQQITTITPN
jgi:hypothetical protein